ncbi:hypothetical protein [Nocardia aurantia]|uniref:DUF1453 domain-containing protein n=1 Tax=Nocardia aurantia TaxID=2585199 RepID=A0A7K0DSR3_9NOCA|nr:hypothetical protein [Nocardia aurantia]MQY28618.1 hypothetical protein [Nocardia aurantia]
MSSAQLLDIVLVVAVLGWIVYRQTRWQVLDPARIWRMPIILTVIGLISLRSTPIDGDSFGTVAVLLLAGSGLLSLGVGALMGVMSQLRVAENRWQARTGWAGSLLWLVLVAVRVGVDVGANALGAKILTSTGVILVMVALNRVGRTLVLVRRADLRLIVAGRAVDTASGGPGTGYRRGPRERYRRRLGEGYRSGPGDRYAGGPGERYAGGPGERYAGGPGERYAGGPGERYAGGPGERYPGGPGESYPGGPGERY